MKSYKEFTDIDKAITKIKYLSASIVVVFFIIVSGILIFAKSLIESNRDRIYVLEDGKALRLAISDDKLSNRPVEIRNHIKVMHNLLFNIEPDPAQIQNDVRKSYYFGDKSIKAIDDFRREKGYYAKIIAGNISTEIEQDSILINTSQYPYSFHFYGKEKLVRPTKIVIKNLETVGKIRDVKRSDNNPHGLFVEDLKVINNQILNEYER